MHKRYFGAALAVVLVTAGCGDQTVQMQPPETDGQTTEACAALVADLPDTLLGADRATVQPESEVMAAWGDPPIGLRCGVPRPSSLEMDSILEEVNGVAWLPQPEDAPTLYTAVEREAYVELTIPPSYGAPAEALVELSDLINEHLEERADSGL
ncbi:DUF3515 domain-containing protein [Nocardiopsis ganjiahuensis]|uniref:DUF3515 domain-containing protein n=1 Tax=Nocardiopsis ganjiahuensis TaxID=239984 RepID=UPI00034B78B5|nr:DUF3515 domain-containing protein [Nocardiopsis ganjiahuensis]